MSLTSCIGIKTMKLLFAEPLTATINLHQVKDISSKTVLSSIRTSNGLPHKPS